MEQQDVGEGLLSFFGVERSEVNTSRCEGFVRRGEHRERTFALQGFHQLGLHQGSHE